jgi:hypothetical protein
VNTAGCGTAGLDLQCLTVSTQIVHKICFPTTIHAHLCSCARCNVNVGVHSYGVISCCRVVFLFQNVVIH